MADVVILCSKRLVNDRRQPARVAARSQDMTVFSFLIAVARSFSHFPGWTRGPAEHAVGLLVVNKLLGSGVPDNLPPQP